MTKRKKENRPKANNNEINKSFIKGINFKVIELLNSKDLKKLSSVLDKLDNKNY